MLSAAGLRSECSVPQPNVASRDTRTPPPARGRWRPALQHLRPYRGWIALGLAVGMVGALAGATEPLFLRYLLDLLVGGHGSAGRLHLAAWAVGGLVAVNLLCQVTQTALAVVTNRVRFDASFELSRRVLDHLFHQPLRFHQDTGVGYVMTRVDRGVGALGQLLADSLQSLTPNLANLLLIAFFLVRLSPRLAVVALLPVPLYLWATLRSTRATVREEEIVQEGWSKVYRRVYEVLGGIKTVKSLAAERREMAHYEAVSGQVFERLWKLVWVDARYSAAKNLLGLAGRAGVLFYGAALVLRGQMTPGTWLAAAGFAAMLYGPLSSLSGVYGSACKNLVAALGAFAFLAAPGEETTVGRRLAHVRGAIAFRDVSFHYPGGAEDGSGSTARGVRNVSFCVEPGEVVALVGPSGSGKTTVADLLLGFHVPQQGAITLDGHDLQSLSRAGLRDHIAVVLQESVLLEGTIAENIAYGRPGASAAEVCDAARRAQAESFILSFPAGYETRVGERGAALSGGQRQRLAIARTLLRDPRVLILDEPTSQLDPESEQAVNVALQTLMRGRTTLIISHRLTSRWQPDRVLVLEDGAVVEAGAPAELLARSGRFAALCHAAHAAPLRSGEYAEPLAVTA